MKIQLHCRASYVKISVFSTTQIFETSFFWVEDIIYSLANQIQQEIIFS